MGENFQQGLKHVRELYMWNERVLAFGGIWPLDKRFFKFYVGAMYFAIHMLLSFADLVNVFGDLSLMIANLLETTTHVTTACKIIGLRYSTLIQEVLEQVQSAFDEERYMDQTEKNLYLSYNAIGRLFFKAGTYFSMVTITMFYLKPFEYIVRAVFENETIPFILPCRVRLFYEITDLPTYAFVYLSQCPMIYYYFMNTISSCFIGSLTIHVAGDLAILAHRIRHIHTSDTSRNYLDPHIAFRNIVSQHDKIITTATAIKDIFNYVLLVELLIMTVLVGLICYDILVKSLAVSMTDFMFLVSYIVAILILILVYCIIGDYLIRESMNVHDAYYECHWYDMTLKYQKHVIICMAQSRRPLQLTAGPFYVFSLPRFTDILKTSMAYISMLRTLV